VNRVLMPLLRVSFVVVLALMVSNQKVLADAGGAQPRDSGVDPLGVGIDYDPYPPGILPNDLVPEIQRVRREIQFIFQQALGEWRALPPMVHTGQPPTIQGVGYRAIQTLGKLMNFDENMSPFRNRACAFCHIPSAAPTYSRYSKVEAKVQSSRFPTNRVHRFLDRDHSSSEL
jgi:hypothetical protein